MKKKLSIVINLFFIILIILSLLTTYLYDGKLSLLTGALLVLGAIWNWYLFRNMLKK